VEIRKPFVQDTNRRVGDQEALFSRYQQEGKRSGVHYFNLPTGGWESTSKSSKERRDC
jgi:hypothetical protein